MTQTGIFDGRVLVPYSYGCFGWTRGGGTYTRQCTVTAEQATASPTSVSMAIVM